MSQIPEINPEGWSEQPVETAGYPHQGYQQQYPQQQQPQQQAAGGFAPADSENVPVMSEFDHLFRDSDPDSRRSVAQPSSPMVRVVGDQVASAVPARYPALNPVPPQWPAPVLGQVAGLDPSPAQPQAQYALPAQYPLEYPAQVQPPEQQYDQQQPPEQLYDQYQQEAQQFNQQQYDQQQYDQQQQYNQQQPQQQQQPEQLYDQYQPEPQQFDQQQYNQTQVLQQQQPDPLYDQTTYLPQTQAQTAYQPGYSGPVSYGPGGPIGPGDGSGEQQWLGAAPGGGKSKRTPALIGAGIAVIAVIGLVMALSGGGSGSGAKKQNTVADSTPTPTLSAAQQAQKLSAIVGQSSQLRDDAIRAVDDLSSSSCSSLSQDQTSLEATAKARSAQATAVAALNVSKLPQGTQLVSDLSQAWQASATSDTAYAAIAGDLVASNVTDCKSSWKKDSNFPAADQADGEATRDKDAAAALWNDNLTSSPINEPAISADQL